MNKCKTSIIDENRNQSSQFVSDCCQCSGLCCIALYCFQSDGFPQDKPIGKPCIHLMNNYRCQIHQQLEEKKMKGCIGYDCFGAGQYLTHDIYHGITWKMHPEKITEICEMFIRIYRLFQMRFFLYESLKLISSQDLLGDIYQLINENEMICHMTIDKILQYSIEDYQDKVNQILKKVCHQLKRYLNIKEKKKQNFIHHNFDNQDMTGVDLNMKLAIASSFKNCQFKGATFIGTDTRDANFEGADLREAIFLTQGQINVAKGSRKTKLPNHLYYPITWK
ncbi:MAG: pentapeptide repeat-containing protein [Faecalibacillus sp.]